MQKHQKTKNIETKKPSR